MPAELIAPEELTRWVPGQLTVHSPEAGWSGAAIRGYRYQGLDVDVPSVRDYMIVAYHHGRTPMRRELDGIWTSHGMRPGDVSLMTRASRSHWVWSGQIDVVHAYLTADHLREAAEQMYERDIADVELHDTLRAEDPAMFRAVMQMAQEASTGGVGSRLLVEALTQELAIRLLRGHAHIRFCRETPIGRLSLAQVAQVEELIDAGLDGDLGVQHLADAAGVDKYRFTRAFVATMGCTPHGYVINRRLERARILLASAHLTLAEVAAQCGFADQSHFTRVFRRHVGTTPGRYRTHR
ncbi:MAG: helix-turn-helix transcriptional regulator [Nostocoides sp.]